MATFTAFRSGGTTGAVAYATFNIEIDIAKVKAAYSGLTTNDKIDFIYVPANSRVDIFQAELVTPGTLATRLDIGDSAADTTWVNNAATFTAGFDMTLATSAKTYTAADAIFLKIGNAATTGVVRINGLIRSTDRRAKAVYPTPTNA